LAVVGRSRNANGSRSYERLPFDVLRNADDD